MGLLHAAGSKLAMVLGVGDSETSDAVYITGMAVFRMPRRLPTPSLRCVLPSQATGPRSHQHVHADIEHAQGASPRRLGVWAIMQAASCSLASLTDLCAPLCSYICHCLLAVSVVLVLFGGLMSGLTLGLMSLDSVQLEVLKRTGSPVEKERAARIMPVCRQAGHNSAPTTPVHTSINNLRRHAHACGRLSPKHLLS